MWHRATILSRRQLSPSVTGLTLRVDPPNGSAGAAAFAFLPGQWVDFRPRPSHSWNPSDADGGRIVGGYSLVSVPRNLPRIELAIRCSRHPVAEWATSRARVDDVVDVQVGGTFTYGGDCGVGTGASESDGRRAGEDPSRLLFVAGGVGINPLYSMVQQWLEDRAADPRSRAVLLYSAGYEEELLFVDRLDELMKENPHMFRVVFAATRGQRRQRRMSGEGGTGTEAASGSAGTAIVRGRIDAEMMHNAVDWLHRSDRDSCGGHERSEEEVRHALVADAVYACGPPGMPEAVEKVLVEEGLVRSADDVRFEKWW